MMVLFQNQYSVSAVSLVAGCHPKTVSRWQNRFRSGHGISDRCRSGRPPKITIDIVQKVVAFYCQCNPLPGCASWSVRWMAIYFQKHPEYLNIGISASTIHRCLKLNSLKPYRRKYFLQICDPLFFEKMEKIIQVYKDDPKNLFCLDECTGLQVLERIAPDLPANSEQLIHQEFEYKRHGTVSIISIMEKRSGRVFTECIPDHTSVTIIESVKRHARLYGSSEKLHYISDNYSSHSTEKFCKEIAKLCQIRLPKLKTAKDRKQWLESDDKRIVFYFLPTHGSWLNLIEIWFSILKQKGLSGKSVTSKSQMEKRIQDFTETWNTYFAHPFKWSYDGQDLYEKVILRLIKWLELETPQMTAQFLEKQLKLMESLAAKHSYKIKRTVWLQLQKTLEDKKDFVCKIIDSIDPANKNSEKQRDNIHSLYIHLINQKMLCRRAA